MRLPQRLTPRTNDEHRPDAPPMERTERNHFPAINILLLAVLVEGGLLLPALGLAYLCGMYDQSQPLTSIDSTTWKSAITWGILGMVPLLLYLAVYIFRPPKLLQPMKDFVDQQLKPLFSKCSLFALAVISLLAGFCEEILFRWSLQGGISSWSGSLWLGLAIASLLFGLCHWVNFAYGVTTTIVGLYLGLLMNWSGTWLAPAIAHAVFDFVALVFITRSNIPSGKNRASQTT
jgi:membrane protease YdiL (CAAX protease family)